MVENSNSPAYKDAATCNLFNINFALPGDLFSLCSRIGRNVRENKSPRKFQTSCICNERR